MDVFLFILSLFAFWVGRDASGLLLRCALAAGQHFSPRAALALASVAALSGALTALLLRGGWRAVPGGQREIAAPAAFVGGTLSRALLLMLVARFPDSLLLARVQAIPLLLLAALALLHPLHPVPGARSLLRLCLLCAAAEGFLGAGGAVLFSLGAPQGVQRGSGVPSCALLLTLCAQTGALLLTLLCGAAQVFPARMPLLLAAGAALGALLARLQKEHGALSRGMHAVLLVYLVLSAFSCLELAI